MFRQVRGTIQENDYREFVTLIHQILSLPLTYYRNWIRRIGIMTLGEVMCELENTRNDEQELDLLLAKHHYNRKALIELLDGSLDIMEGYYMDTQHHFIAWRKIARKQEVDL
jgi:hypothetical protein